LSGHFGIHSYNDNNHNVGARNVNNDFDSNLKRNTVSNSNSSSLHYLDRKTNYIILYLIFLQVALLFFGYKYITFTESVVTSEQKEDKFKHDLLEFESSQDLRIEKHDNDIDNILSQMLIVQKSKQQIYSLQKRTSDLEHRTDDVTAEIQRTRISVEDVKKRTSDLEIAFGLPYEDHLTK
jgi:hypothetical protein